MAKKKYNMTPPMILERIKTYSERHSLRLDIWSGKPLDKRIVKELEMGETFKTKAKEAAIRGKQ